MTDARVIPSGANEGTSSSLLERVRQQDQVAWGQLVDLYTPLVWRWCRRCGLKPTDIEDVTQEVFRSVHRALPSFRKEKPGDSFRAWLRVIALNKVRDHWARNPVQAAGGTTATGFLGEIADPKGDPAAEGEEQQEVSILYRRAVHVLRSEFEDRTWQAFWRVSVDNESVADVAVALGMTANAIYLARSRIRRRLKGLLVELGEHVPDDEPNAEPKSELP